MTTPYNQVSRTAARALEEFSDEFRNAYALGEVTQWAEQIGLVRNTDALKTTFPIPFDAAGYREFKDDVKFRHLYSRSLSMKSKLWQDGVEEFARVIEAPDFIDWAGAPARMAMELLRLPNELVASMLAANSYDGPLLDLYRDEETNTASARRLFATDHPYSLIDSSVGTFNNTDTTTLASIANGTFVEEMNDHFRGIKGPNGKPLGLRMSGGMILVPSTRENVFKKFLEHDTLIRAVGANAAVTQNNIWAKTIHYMVADELASQDYVYAIAAGRPGLVPWIVQKGPVEEIRHDKDSEKYKNTFKVAIAEVAELAVAAALPHAIIRVQITS